jgi:type III secretory pathway component EscV/tetratricopeptide (TPR) repeat protein
MPEGTHFDRLRAVLLLNESFLRLDARVTEDALRAIRSEFGSSSNPFDRHRAICAQIGATENAEWRRLLMQLREQFEAEALAEKIDEIERLFARSQDEGWMAWVIALVEAVTHFRHRYAAGLCRHRFPFDPSREEFVRELRRAVECMRQGRWEETYEEIVLLAKQDFLPAPLQARMIALRGQVELWRFDNPSRARDLLEEAGTLAPSDGVIAAALGDYWLNQKDTEKAEACYRRAIDLAPKDANGYVGMGDRFEKEGRLDDAEAWNRKAIASAGGDGLGYERLLSLLGRSENLSTRGADFRVLLMTRIDVDSDSEYEAYVNAGDTYLAAELLSEAKEWFEKAVALEKDWPRAYTQLAALCRTQGNLSEAEAYCRKAIEVAPDCPSGYIVLGRLCEQQSRWAEALRLYQAFPRRPLQWVSFARASVGRLQAKLGNYEEAERVLFDGLREELRSDRMQSHTQRGLENLAAGHFRERSDEDSARRIYDGLLQLLGDEYRCSYHHLLGNMHYELGNYEAAVADYREAISAAPGSAVYHRDLGNAYESLGKYDDAQRELDSAYRIDGDGARFQKAKAGLENTQGNRNYERAAYGEAADHYNKAIELDPEESVYHANLAGALARVKKPGKRMDALNHAIQCYERARELTRRDDYADEIDRLRRKQAVLRMYGEKALDYLHVVTPIAVEVASDLIPVMEGSKPNSLSEEMTLSVGTLRDDVKKQLGVSIPGIRVRGNETDLPNGTYIVMINEIPLVSGNVSLTRRFCTGSEEILSALNVKHEPASDPLSGQQGFWIDRKDWEKLESKARVKLWGIAEYVTRHLEAVVRRNIAEFVGYQEIVNLLEGESGDAFIAIRRSPEMVNALTKVCRALVAEETPICPFAVLCAIFRDLHANGVGLRDIVECIRSHHAFRERLPGNDRKHSYLELGTRFEAEIRHALYERDGRSILAMEPERCQNALGAIREKFTDRSHVLVVKDATLRPFVRKLVELEFPDLHVLSHAELREDAEIEPDALIDLGSEPAAPPAEFTSRRRVDRAVAAPGDVLGCAAAASSEIRVEAFVSEDFAAKNSVADDVPPAEMLAMMQDGLFYELGIIVPEVHLRTDPDLGAAEFRIRINGVERPPSTGLRHNEFLVNDTVDRLTLLDIKGREAVNPANGSECAIVEDGEDRARICKKAGLTIWGHQGYLVLELSAEIREAAPRFQTDEVTQFMLDAFAEAFPGLTKAVLGRYTLSQLAQVLRELLDEEISIRDLPSILQSLLSIDGTTDVDLNRFVVFLANTDGLCPASPSGSSSDLKSAKLADFVRMNLRRYISHKYTRGGNILVVYLLDPVIENRIADIGARPLTEEEHQKLRTAIEKEVGNLPYAANNSPVLLTTFDIRRALRKIIERKFPRLAVLSYQELSPDLNIQPIARVSWN